MKITCDQCKGDGLDRAAQWLDGSFASCAKCKGDGSITLPDPPASPRDVQITNEGSIWLFEPLTEAGKLWINQHISEDAAWFGPSLVVEHRYARDIVQGMRDAGLRLV